MRLEKPPIKTRIIAADGRPPPRWFCLSLSSPARRSRDTRATGRFAGHNLCDFSAGIRGKIVVMVWLEHVYSQRGVAADDTDGPDSVLIRERPHPRSWHVIECVSSEWAKALGASLINCALVD